MDTGDSGLILKSCSISEIQEAVVMLAEKPLSQQKDEARRAWEFARSYHTRERYAEVYRGVITGLLAMGSSPATSHPVSRTADVSCSSSSGPSGDALYPGSGSPMDEDLIATRQEGNTIGGPSPTRESHVAPGA